MVQKTASTLTGEYVTAHGNVGETEGRSKIRDKNTLYKERAKRRRSDEATWEKWGGGNLVRSAKRGRLTMELGVVMTRQNFGFPCSFFALSLSVCQGKGGRRSTRARGRLSEAKTQRQPHSARESVGEGGCFPLLFCCFCFS